MAATTSRAQLSAMARTGDPVVVGHGPNFWLFTNKGVFDMTHPPTPSSPPVHPRLTLQTTRSPVTIAPTKTALVIIDMQNFFLSAAMGRSRGEGHDAEDTLLSKGIPAARKTGIQVVWLTWGITDAQLQDLPPTIWRIFGWESQDEPEYKVEDDDAPPGTTITVPEKKDDGGIGAPLGEVRLDNGTVVDAGRMLMLDQWNTALHPPMEQSFQQGLREADPPDVRFHKQRLSGLWGDSQAPLESFLRDRGIRTLLFAGVNTDQCVLATVQDASNKGFDTVLLRDGCGTTSPEFARQMVDYNCQKSWGFISTCDALADGVQKMMMHKHEAGKEVQGQSFAPAEL
ncbi:isochorismatase family protein [Microdochium trichocladiopsis]|uniref:Isochorismatase family protein n=1 Tax=Microdochium trichocladiopsis TaxID=1682393 RepID=A0A9P8Y3R8_9PEZI|nr:isochorismatase family protein [Microdochium trichocladiopsis]KAH7028820.1 isochorismatase family protein [Microdochium trichocladiopsis]